MGKFRNQFHINLTMGILSFFKRFKKQEPALRPIKTARVRLRDRLRTKTKKKYLAEVAVTYNGRPIGKISVSDLGYSRDVVAAKIQAGLGMKVISAHEDKSKKK